MLFRSLQGADGVAFIADSRVSETRGNNESFANLKHNLKQNGLGFDDVAVVIQFNKRDLPGIRSDAEIERIASKGREPIYQAVAIEGVGVAETFTGLACAAWRKLERNYGLKARFGVEEDEFMSSLNELFAPALDEEGNR